MLEIFFILTGASPAPPPAGDNTNKFRLNSGQKLKSYAQMPMGTYGEHQSMPYMMGQSPGMIPPAPMSSMMSTGQPLSMSNQGSLPAVPPSIQSSVSMPMAASMSPFGGPPVAQVNPTISQTSYPPQRSQASFDMDKTGFSGAPQGGFYQPVRAHWCFSKPVENRLIWYPFTLKDSMAIEEAYRNGKLTFGDTTE